MKVFFTSQRKHEDQLKGCFVFVLEGDGANDVSMIQVADVGIGISGQEGMQVMNLRVLYWTVTLTDSWRF